jgi:putative transposase
LIDKYDKHPISTDGGTWYPPQAYRLLKLKHHLHSPFEKIIIERTIQYIKDRTGNLMTTFHAEKGIIVNNHVKKWLNLFAYYYNKEIISS